MNYQVTAADRPHALTGEATKIKSLRRAQVEGIVRRELLRASLSAGSGCGSWRSRPARSASCGRTWREASAECSRSARWTTSRRRTASCPGDQAAGAQYGPAPRSMDRSAIRVEADGRLIVNTGKITLGPLPVAPGEPGIIPPRTPTGCT